MLGLARASQWAGWWSQGEPQALDMTLTFAVEATPEISPRYAANWTAADPAPAFSTICQYLQDTDGANIDMSNIGLQDVSTVNCLTFRVGQDWMNPNPSVALMDLIAVFDVFNAPDSAEFRKCGLVTDGQGNIRLAPDDSIGYDIGPEWPTEWRDRWMTWIISTSNNSADFSDWSAGTNANDIYARIYLVDARTGEVLINYDDDQTYNDYSNTIDLSEQWVMAFDDSTGNYYYGSFTSSSSDDWISGNLDQVEIATAWKCFGSTIDPAGNVSLLAGFAPATTVQGQQAWARAVVLDAGEALTNGNAVTYGYTANVPNSGQRLPDYNWFIATDDDTVVTAPTFTDVNT